MRSLWIMFAGALALWSVGCGDDGGTTDAGTDAGAACDGDDACDDGLFCNGTEVCDSAMGCMPDPSGGPCAAGETCDETADALYDPNQGLLGHLLHSQVELHAEFGGVVPELASRDHVRKLIPLLRELLTVTDTELAVLQVLWNEKTATVRYIAETLYGDTDKPQHATVQKLLDRLKAKGFVARDRTVSPDGIRAAIRYGHGPRIPSL